jgi:hypothetical protein
LDAAPEKPLRSPTGYEHEKEFEDVAGVADTISG